MAVLAHKGIGWGSVLAEDTPMLLTAGFLFLVAILLAERSWWHFTHRRGATASLLACLAIYFLRRGLVWTNEALIENERLAQLDRPEMVLLNVTLVLASLVIAFLERAEYRP
jgi:hypothetical protein